MPTIDQRLDELDEWWKDSLGDPSLWMFFDDRLARLRAMREFMHPAQLARWHLHRARRAEVLRERGVQLHSLNAAYWILSQSSDTDATFEVKREIDAWFSHPAIFVSYARKDYALVKQLVEYLTACGAAVRWDEHFQSGDISANIIAAMEVVRDEASYHSGRVDVDAELQAAGIYLVVWSRNYVGRPYTEFELERAFRLVDEASVEAESTIRVIFVRIDDQELPDRYLGELYAQHSPESAEPWAEVAKRVGLRPPVQTPRAIVPATPAPWWSRLFAPFRARDP